MSDTRTLDDFRPGDVVKVIDHDANNPYGQHHFEIGSLGTVSHVAPTGLFIEQPQADRDPLTQVLQPSEVEVQPGEVCS